MQIWVDADACPVAVRDIIVRAAQRRQILTTFVANQPLPIPPSPWLKSLQVSGGFDVADNEIVRRVSAGDLVITQDIPLAAEVLALGAFALGPRGERHTPNSIGARLSMRDFMDTLRGSGIHTGGPPPLSQTDRREFANQFDRLLQLAGAQPE